MALVFLLFLILLDIIEILIIFVRLVCLGLGFSLLSFLLILFILHLLLGILGDGPQVLSGLLGSLGVVSDHEIVENSSRLDLPQVKPELAHLLKLANGLGLLLIVLGVLDLGVDPGTLVVRVINLLGFPLSLVLGVVNHGRLPLSVHLIVPVLGLGGVGVSDVLGLLPVLGLGILGVINLGSVNPVSSEGSLLGGLVIDEDLVCAVSVDNQGVEMSEHIVLAPDVLLDQVVLALVGEDDVDLLGAGAADVRAEHDVVRGVSV